MKVYCLRPNHEGFLLIRECNFSETNREPQREHAKSQNQAEFVWFEDEEPPQEVIDILQQEHAKFLSQESSDETPTATGD